MTHDKNEKRLASYRVAKEASEELAGQTIGEEIACWFEQNIINREGNLNFEELAKRIDDKIFEIRR